MQTATPENIKAAAQLAVPLVNAIIQTWVLPRLEALKRDRALGKELESIVLEDSLRHYLTRAYAEHSYLSTIVLQYRPKKLVDLYLPLTLRLKDSYGSVTVDGYPNTFLTDHPRLLIVDDAGMGKSTVMKRMFLDAIERNRGIPVFIPLRRVTADGLIKAIARSMSSLTKPVSESMVMALLERGDFILFLDGLDEVPAAATSAVTGDLMQVLERAPGNTVVISSRLDETLSGLPRFTHCEIVPLDAPTAYRMLRLYDNDGEQSQALIKTLQEERYQSALAGFLANPLLVSLLLCAYQYKQHIPLSRIVFYRQVYDALFNTHDYTKGDGFVREKKSGLGVDDMHMVLRAFGFGSAKQGSLQYSRDELERQLRQAKSSTVGGTSAVGDLIHDLLVSVPVLQRDGLGYRWAHKALQDYFASQFIYTDTGERQGAVLRALTSARTWMRFAHVLELLDECDPRSLRRHVYGPFVAAVCAAFEGASRLDNEPWVQAYAAFSVGEQIEVFVREPGDVSEDPDIALLPGKRLWSASKISDGSEMARFLVGIRNDSAMYAADAMERCFGNAWYREVNNAVEIIRAWMDETATKHLRLFGQDAWKPATAELGRAAVLCAGYVIRDRVCFDLVSCQHQLRLAEEDSLLMSGLLDNLTDRKSPPN